MTTKLLVVDDEATIRNFLVRVLERAGYEVHGAADGREALSMMENTPFDLLLTDIKMGHMDGVELLKVAHENYPDMTVILFTGHATVPSAVEALRKGAFDYLLKPVENEEIVRVVAEGLQHRERQQRRDRLEQIAGQIAQVVQLEDAAVLPAAGHRVIQVGALELDLDAYTVELDGQRLDLTPTEFRLLAELARSSGAALDYVALVQNACGYSCTRQEAREIIGTHVLNLRRKMDIKKDQTYYVESVRGVGYRLIPPDHR
jgi:DNA-binding response OmpR family regulator